MVTRSDEFVSILVLDPVRKNAPAGGGGAISRRGETVPAAGDQNGPKAIAWAITTKTAPTTRKMPNSGAYHFTHFS